MSITLKPSKPFSNGMSYDFFLESFCYRCKHGKVNANGFPEHPENGGCKIWDVCENARFDISLYPKNDIVKIEKNGKIVYWNVCKSFETDDKEVMERFNDLLKGARE